MASCPGRNVIFTSRPWDILVSNSVNDVSSVNSVNLLLYNIFHLFSDMKMT